MEFIRERGLWLPDQRLCSVAPGIMPIFTNAAGGGGTPPTSNLQFWYKSEDITGLSDGQRIGSANWPNAASGGNFPNHNLRDGAGISAATYHTTGFSGRPKVTFLFTEPDQLFVRTSAGASPDLSSWTAATTYIVVKSANDPGTTGGCSAGDAGFWQVGNPDGLTTHPFTDGKIFESWGTTNFADCGDPTPSLAVLHYYSVTSASGSYKVHLNGTQLFSRGTNTVSFSGGFQPLSLGVTTVFGCQSFFNGDVVEWLVYDVAHDDTQRGTVNTYLAGRWGL